MKLIKCEPFVVRVPPPCLGGKFWYFVKLVTDDGIVGYGETALTPALYGFNKTYRTMVSEIYDKYFHGRDPMCRERLYDCVYNDMMLGNAGLFAVSVLSAFDMAIWDIAGKAMNMPIYQMLGGKYREKIRTYSYISFPDRNVWQKRMWEEHLEESADQALALVEEGFTAVKFDPLPYENLYDDNMTGTAFGIRPFQISLKDLRRVEKALSLVRNRIGDRADIILGTHGQTTTSAAIRLAKVVEQFDPLWFEEPVPPENVDEMARVRQATSIPIASGERLAGLHQFRSLIESGAVDIIQPDLAMGGGFTVCKKVAAIAQGHYIDIAPHVFGGPLVTFAAMHLDVSSPNFLIQESICKSGLFHAELATNQLVWQDGYFMPPQGAGLGTDLNEDVLRKHLAD